jgi:hypothetical protein
MNRASCGLASHPCRQKILVVAAYPGLMGTVKLSSNGSNGFAQNLQATITTGVGTAKSAKAPINPKRKMPPRAPS